MKLDFFKIASTMCCSHAETAGFGVVLQGMLDWET